MERKPIVWIIDREQWPRAYLRAELIERGFDVAGYPGLARALILLGRERMHRPLTIVLGMRGQRITRRTLKLMAIANIPIIGIGGTVELNNPLVKEFRWEKLLHRPTTIGALADAVERSVQRGS